MNKTSKNQRQLKDQREKINMFNYARSCKIERENALKPSDMTGKPFTGRSIDFFIIDEM